MRFKEPLPSNRGSGMPDTKLSADGREDARMVKKCLRGDPDAFAALVVKYQDPVFNTAYRMVGDREVARDLAQEAFVRAFEGMAEFDPGMPFRPWVFRICTNAAIDHLRRSSRRGEVGIDDAFPSGEISGEMPGGPTVSPQERTPETESIENETSLAVHRALQGLPDNYRAVVVLHYIEGMSFREIAAMMGIPRNTAKTWAKRARAILHESLEGVI